MRQNRVIALYAGFLLAFFIVLCRLYSLATNTEYAERAQSQTVTTLPLGDGRGNFYDCDGNRLTGGETVYYALCIPGEESYSRLFDFAGSETQSVLYQKRNSAVPFLVPVESDLTSQGIDTYQSQRRYAAQPICVHLLGYLDDTGSGITGLEAAFEEVLSGSAEQSYVQCVTNGQGQLMDETEPVLSTPQNKPNGVQLTISRSIQRACEGVASGMMSTGCIMVLDTATAEVRASVSYPFYDPENVEQSIRANDTSLINRAFRAYNVGSVFKPVLAAAALEEGLDWLTIDCKGYLDINGHIYRCAGGVPHGPTTLQSALEQSCNCYFIELGNLLGAQRLVEYAEAFGFGQPVYLAGGLKAASGNLPDQQTLTDLGQRANFSFGQGQLLATPLQLAAMMNAIAAKGQYTTPVFLKRILEEDTLQTVQTLEEPTTRTVMSEGHAQTLQAMLQAVVEQGIGGEAQPGRGSAAGKTGTAQTGRYNEVGEEYKDLWFAGFYPAEDPQYTIVVMQDDQTRAEHSSAAIFSKVCDALCWLEQDALPSGEAAAPQQNKQVEKPAQQGAEKSEISAQNS